MSDEDDLYEEARQITDDEAMQKHIVERQLTPQAIVERLQDEGANIDVVMAHVGDNDAPGYVTLTCIGCGRTAQVHPESLPANFENKASLCPLCMRGGGE